MNIYDLSKKKPHWLIHSLTHSLTDSILHITNIIIPALFSCGTAKSNYSKVFFSFSKSSLRFLLAYLKKKIERNFPIAMLQWVNDPTYKTVGLDTWRILYGSIGISNKIVSKYFKWKSWNFQQLDIIHASIKKTKFKYCTLY